MQAWCSCLARSCLNGHYLCCGLSGHLCLGPSSTFSSIVVALLLVRLFCKISRMSFLRPEHFLPTNYLPVTPAKNRLKNTDTGNGWENTSLKTQTQTMSKETQEIPTEMSQKYTLWPRLLNITRTLISRVCHDFSPLLVCRTRSLFRS